VTRRRNCKIRRAVPLILLTASLIALCAFPARAGDFPFTYPSNLGLTGLMETPTARVMKENRYRLGASIVDPYRQYYGTVGIFPRIEVNGRVTEIRGVPGFNDGSSYGDYKDKAVDLKFQILREGKFTPAFAVVIMDPHGTRLYSAQALVASKQIYPFDFTIGMGNGRYGKEPLPATGEGFGLELFTDPKKWWKDANVFGGVQFALTDKFVLMAEYSPIEYNLQTNDPAQARYFTEPVPSKVNFGARWKPTRWSEIDVTYQRGNQLGVGFSLAFDIGNPLVPIRDRPYREPTDRLADPASDRIAAALSESGFSNIGVDSDGITLHVEAQNDRYFFATRAVDVILSIVASRMPETVDYLHVMLKENGIPSVDFITTRTGIDMLHAGEIDRNRFLDLSTMKSDEDLPYVRKTVHRHRFDYDVNFSLETFLNDPSGFFKYRFGIAGLVSATTWKGGSLVAGAEYYPLNTVSTSAVPLSIPVRSDIAEYKKEDVSLSRLLFEQIHKTRVPLYGRIAGGLLEIMYAGLDGEIAAPLLNGRILAGISGSAVKKREPDSAFGLISGADYYTAFVNGRLNIPEIDVFLDVKAGRFLAGDKGARVTLSKSINGVVLSAWYSFTDTSIFTDPLNDGYHDKGISVTIPLRLFLGRDSKTSYRYSMSPWTRDAGQDIYHYRTLFDYIGRNVGVWLSRDRKEMVALPR
jgi:hypothetical protein